MIRSPSYPSNPSSRPKRPESRQDAELKRAASAGDARGVVWIVLAVILFTAMFGGVIGFKLYQESVSGRLEAQTTHSREAVFLSEAATRTLQEAVTALNVALSDIDALPAEELPEVLDQRLAPIRALTAVEAIEYLAPGADMPPALEPLARTALSSPNGLATWPTSPEGPPRIVMAVPIAMQTGEVGAVLLQLSPDALLPTYGAEYVAILVDADARPLAMQPPRTGGLFSESLTTRFGLPPQTVRQLAASGEAMTGVRIGEQEMVIAAAPTPFEGLNVVVIGTPNINQGAWMRTRILYGLLFVAPVIFAIGLSAALSTQMSSLKSARIALGDSEKRFRLAIEGARCGVWDWDRKKDTVYLTDSFARILGRDDAQMLSGAEFLSLFSQRDRERISAAVRGSVRAGDVDVEVQASGVPVWLHLRGRPWGDIQDGLTDRLVGVAIDITERKGAQARVAAAENRLRAALESMSESFVLWDRRRCLVMWNRKFRDFFHFTETALKPGMTYAEVETGAARAIRKVQEGTGSGEAFEMELKDGRWLHYSERSTSDGGLVSVGADITDLKNQEKALKESEQRLRNTVEDVRRNQQRIAELANKYEKEKIRAEEANRSKSEFLANMSHELRTPLNAVNGFSEIMLREMFGPLGDNRYVDYVKDIHTSGQHLLSLINDILDMSKIEAGKMKLQKEPVSLADIAEQSLRLVKARAEEKSIRLVSDLDDNLADLNADPRALKQVILNLLSNAVKFTPEEGRVSIRSFAIDDRVALQVRDTGIGIPKEDLPRLGRPFEQIESQHSKSHQGTGLGLALSKSLVEMHGGQIAIESELGKGTTVTLTIPFNGGDENVQAEDLEPERRRVASDAA
ncbi:PAS domain-containing sensor histidine kinase [Hyphobacterium sp.]|jgi:two-component system cell cycle sensor histidine kinase PleC|uniref:PAS domain-containing sensor histidine kinase n=1 Tax=Hyphobacterium sp. TaxID=2004662 RepID=UPI003BADAEE9